MHCMRDCPQPEKSKQVDNFISNINIAFVTKHTEYSLNETSSLLRETLSCMVLDIGITATVIDLKWFGYFLDISLIR